MNRRYQHCAAFLCVAFAGVVASARAASTDPVGAVAQIIEDNYFDAGRARAIAEDLRKAVRDGEFRRYDDPRELASAVTERLKPHDAHFNVRWGEPGSAPTGSGQVVVRRGPAEGPVTGAEAPGSGPVVVRRSVGEPAPGGAQPGPGPEIVRRGPGPGGPGGPTARAGGVHRVERLPGNVGYLELREFANFRFGRPDEPARRAIEAALQLLADADAVIVDLRGNGGGSPAMVGYLTSAFTPRGADIYNTFHTRNGSFSEAPRDWHPDPRLDVPLHVLTSARTGSAAEAFVYTVQQAKRATIVGEASGGAANPGGEFDAGNGFFVFVSTGSPENPISHRNWEGTGVVPDVAVPQERALDEATRLAQEAIVAKAGNEDEAREARWALDAARAASGSRTVADTSRYAGRYGVWEVAAEAGRLTMRRGRWPAVDLLPLEADLFAWASDPRRRTRFERDAGGAPVALETLDATGSSTRHRRVVEQPAADSGQRRPDTVAAHAGVVQPQS
jgi:hypothetical protein